MRDARPRVPETDEENARLVGILEALDDLPELSRERERLADILTVLVTQYERRYEMGSATPLEALRSLMEDRGLRQRDS